MEWTQCDRVCLYSTWGEERASISRVMLCLLVSQDRMKHVYQAEAFIYTHLDFLFSSTYRSAAMVTTFPPQVRGIHVGGHISQTNPGLCLFSCSFPFFFSFLFFTFTLWQYKTFFFHVTPTTSVAVYTWLCVVADDMQVLSACWLYAESTVWQVEPVSVFSWKQKNLHRTHSDRQA